MTRRTNEVTCHATSSVLALYLTSTQYFMTRVMSEKGGPFLPSILTKRIRPSMQWVSFACQVREKNMVCSLDTLELKGNSVNIVITLRAWRPGFDSRQGQGFSSLPLCPEWLWAHPASCPTGTVDSLFGGKAAGAWN